MPVLFLLARNEKGAEGMTPHDKIKADVKNMDIVCDFLGLKGMFVGDMVHIGISDLAIILQNSIVIDMPMCISCGDEEQNQ